jgi:hypothetical protein
VADAGVGPRAPTGRRTRGLCSERVRRAPSSASAAGDWAISRAAAGRRAPRHRHTRSLGQSLRVIVSPASQQAASACDARRSSDALASTRPPTDFASRAASFTGAPITVYSKRRDASTFPATAGPAETRYRPRAPAPPAEAVRRGPLLLPAPGYLDPQAAWARQRSRARHLLGTCRRSRRARRPLPRRPRRSG